MVLVRSPKRRPWLRGASSPRAAGLVPAAEEAAAAVPAAAAAHVGASSAAIAGDGKALSLLLDTAAAAKDVWAEGGSPPPAATGRRPTIIAPPAIKSARTEAAAPSAAAEKRAPADRGTSFASCFSPPFPAKTYPRRSPRRKTTFSTAPFQAAAPHSLTASDLHHPPPPTTAAVGARAASRAPGDASSPLENAVAAALRREAAAGEGGGEATATAGGGRETTPGRSAVVPFSRCAARRLARVPTHGETAAAKDVATAEAAATARGGGTAGGGLNRRRAPALLRHVCRMPSSEAGEPSLCGEDVSLQIESCLALAAGSATGSKRMRCAQRSSPRSNCSSTVAGTSRSTMGSEGVEASFPLPRKWPLTTPAIPAAANLRSSSHRPAAAAVAAAAAEKITHFFREAVPAAATCTAVCVSATPLAASTLPAAPTSATEFGPTASPAATPVAPVAAAAAAALSTPFGDAHKKQQQQQLQQLSRQAVALLQQLPASRALHDYVQEATRTGLFRRERHAEETSDAFASNPPAFSAAASSSSSSSSTADLIAVAASSAACPPPSTARPAPLARVTTAAAATIASPNKTAPLSTAAASYRMPPAASNAAAAAPTPEGAINLAAVADAAGTLSALASHAAGAAFAREALPGASSFQTLEKAEGRGYRNTSGTSNEQTQQQQLVLPRTAEELVREWRPTVNNVIRRLCDMREEEKQIYNGNFKLLNGIQNGRTCEILLRRMLKRVSGKHHLYRRVTQFIILEGRVLRSLRHASKALEKKRGEVEAVYATAAQQETEQQEAHMKSEASFELVQRQAEDAAGGHARLERRLKDTQQKKNQILLLRRQLYEEMFACALLREKKCELAKQVRLLKEDFARKETGRNAVYQLLQRATRLRLLHCTHNGNVLRGALIPEGKKHSTQQQEEEVENLLLPETPEDEEELLLQQQQEQQSREKSKYQWQQLCGDLDESSEERRQQVMRKRLQQQQAGWGVDCEEQGNELDVERQTEERKCLFAIAPSDDCSCRSRVEEASSPLQLRQQPQRALPGKHAPTAAPPFLGMETAVEGQHKDACSFHFAQKETAASDNTEGKQATSLCRKSSTDPYTDGVDNCKKLIALKAAGEPALVTVDCRRRDGAEVVCKNVDALWELIGEAIGLPPSELHW